MLILINYKYLDMSILFSTFVVEIRNRSITLTTKNMRKYIVEKRNLQGDITYSKDFESELDAEICAEVIIDDLLDTGGYDHYEVTINGQLVN